MQVKSKAVLCVECNLLGSITSMFLLSSWKRLHWPDCAGAFFHFRGFLVTAWGQVYKKRTLESLHELCGFFPQKNWSHHVLISPLFAGSLYQKPIHKTLLKSYWQKSAGIMTLRKPGTATSLLLKAMIWWVVPDPSLLYFQFALFQVTMPKSIFNPLSLLIERPPQKWLFPIDGRLKDFDIT